MPLSTVALEFSESSIQSEFDTRFLDTAARQPEPYWLEVRSESEVERYAFSGARPRLQRRSTRSSSPEVIGTRYFRFDLVNELYQTQVRVPYQKYKDSSADFVRSWIQDAVDAAAKLPHQLAADLLNNGFSATDGINHAENYTEDANGHFSRTGTTPFFDDAHTWYGANGAAATPDNDLALDLTAANLNTAWTAATTLYDDQGAPLGVTPDVIVYRPEDEITVFQILNSQTFPLTTADTSAANFYRDGRLRAVKNLYLTDTDSWFLLDTSLNPLIMQTNEDPMVSIFSPQGQVGQASLEAAENDEVIAHVTWRGSAGYGLWQGAVGSTGA